jgi:hypothetical protein
VVVNFESGDIKEGRRKKEEEEEEEEGNSGTNST